jgi:hypothetical protein
LATDRKPARRGVKQQADASDESVVAGRRGSTLSESKDNVSAEAVPETIQERRQPVKRPRKGEKVAEENAAESGSVPGESVEHHHCAMEPEPSPRTEGGEETEPRHTAENTSVSEHQEQCSTPPSPKKKDEFDISSFQTPDQAKRAVPSKKTGIDEFDISSFHSPDHMKKREVSSKKTGKDKKSGKLASSGSRPNSSMPASKPQTSTGRRGKPPKSSTAKRGATLIDGGMVDFLQNVKNPTAEELFDEATKSDPAFGRPEGQRPLQATASILFAFQEAPEYVVVYQWCFEKPSLPLPNACVFLLFWSLFTAKLYYYKIRRLQ